ncbi:MAG TPA: hypothetical protein PK264_17340, partial [Hyphomicrobiaceae bacterium]|nr:hypothetical protein [Hyphomicrobiaceae bacterium]
IHVAATMIERGDGTAADVAEAVRWYERAAEKGTTDAMFRLGEMSLDGIGMGRDDGAAFKWFERGAKAGHPRSKAMLGYLYETGRGTTASLMRAASLYAEAAAAYDARGKLLNAFVRMPMGALSGQAEALAEEIYQAASLTSIRGEKEWMLKYVQNNFTRIPPVVVMALHARLKRGKQLVDLPGAPIEEVVLKSIERLIML